MEIEPGNDRSACPGNWNEETGTMLESEVGEENKVEGKGGRWFKRNRKPLRAESIPGATHGRM